MFVLYNNIKTRDILKQGNDKKIPFIKKSQPGNNKL